MALPVWVRAWIDTRKEATDYYVVDGGTLLTDAVQDTSGDARVCRALVRFVRRLRKEQTDGG